MKMHDALFVFISVTQQYKVPLLVSVVLTFFSLLVNLVCLFLPKRSEDFSWKPRMTFFRNLILNNLISTFTASLLVILLSSQHWATMFSTWRKVYYFLKTVSSLISYLSISCMALERYFFVCRSGSYLVKVTQKCPWSVLVIIWVYSLFIGTMVIVLFDIGQNNAHGTNGGFHCVLVVFVFVFLLFLCVLPNAFVYREMSLEARHAVMPFNKDAYKKRTTVAFYCVMLVVQMLPLLLGVGLDALWKAFVQDDQVKTSQMASPAELILWQLTLLLVPPMINPLLYALKCPEMRKSLSDVFKGGQEKRSAVVHVEHIRMRPLPAQAD